MASNSALDDLGFAPTGSSIPAPATNGDPAVWTLLGEAGGDPKGQLAVASTIANRAQRLKTTPQAVVTDPAQGYEAWQDADARARVQSQYPVGSPGYVAAQQMLQGLGSGTVQPLPYDSFYSPKAQAALGRKPPSFEDGKSGVDIGGNRFFSTQPAASTTALDDFGLGAPGNAVVAGAPASAPAPHAPALAKVSLPTIQAEGAKLAATNPGTPAATVDAALAPGGDYGVFNADTGQNLNDTQQKAYRTLQNAGKIDANATPGSHNLPYAQILPTDVAPQGAYWMDTKGVVHEPTYPAGQGPLDRALIGGKQGVANVWNTISAIPDKLDDATQALFDKLPGASDPVAPNASQRMLQADLLKRRINDQLYQNSPAYNIGKVGGEAVTSTPLLAAGGAAGGMALEGAGAPGLATFLGGGAAGNAFIRSASMGANGVLQGGGASALTSSGSDVPVSQQIATGSLFGGGLGMLAAPAVNAVARTVSRYGAPVLAPEVADLAHTAVNKFNIPLRLRQIQGATDPVAMLKDSQSLEKFGSGAAANQAEQKVAFTKAALQQTGADEPDVAAAIQAAGGDPAKAIPETVGAIRSALGNRYNAIAARTNIALDPQLDADLAGIQKMSGEVGLDAGQASSVAAQIQKIRDAATLNGGKITGAQYKGITDTGSSLSVLQKAYGPLGDLAGQVNLALNGALERSAAPEDAALLRQTDKYYKNLMTLAPIADVGKTDIAGNLNPVLLAARVRSNFSNSAFTGAGNLGDLAKVGQTFMKPPTNTNTASRLIDHLKGPLGAAATLVGVGGEGTALWMHDPIAAASVAAAPLMVAGAKVGGNMLEGSRFGAAAGAKAVNDAMGAAPNKFWTSPETLALRNFVNDNYIAPTVIGNNGMQRQPNQ